MPDSETRPLDFVRARGASAEHVVRYVLAISMLLAVVALAIVVLAV